MAQVRCIFAFEIPVTSQHVCPRHQHACTEIVLAGATRGVLCHGSTRQPYAPGQLLVYQPGEDHWIENQEAGKQMCIGVTGCGATHLRCGVWQATDEIETTFDHVRSVAARFRDALQQEQLDLWAGLVVLALRSQLMPPAEPAPTEHYAQMARQIIETRFNERLDLQQLADCLYISPAYLRQLFRQEYGQGPIQYLIGKRINFAGEMLRATDWPVKRIAAACGFENPQYFSRLFRRVIGQTPQQYRGRISSKTQAE